MKKKEIDLPYGFKAELIEGEGKAIRYFDNQSFCYTPHVFDISLGNDFDIPIEIKYKDKFGSQMNFIHYGPTNLGSMLVFIAQGYNINLRINMSETQIWWDDLTFEEQSLKIKKWLKSINEDTTSKHPDRLTGKDIEEIYKFFKK